MTRRADFLFELGTEELPPAALLKLSRALQDNFCQALEQAGLSHKAVRSYASPRRLALFVEGLQSEQPATRVERRGPALTAAFNDQGEPTPAALGFARSCGVDVNALDSIKSDQGAWLVHRFTQPGQATAGLLPDMLQQALQRLPVPKYMRWGDLDAEFVRPVHWLVMLLGDEVVAGSLYGVKAGRETRGHRFHHPDRLYLAEPAAYAPLLESEGRVMADFDARREAVRAQALEVAVASGGRAVIDEDLLDEVTGMVEWPVAILGEFETKFLDVPPEVLISAMKSHQKYFHVVDDDGGLLPCFVTVSNIDSRDIDVVRAGNERVIRPRLADAAFFWNQDRRQRLDTHVEALKHVVFQKKLGSLYDKTLRVRELAGDIAKRLDIDHRQPERAALLSKCDLLTSMVGEFPDLQGVMGRYYARHDGEADGVAAAIDEQYMPRYAGDGLPATVPGQILSLADKLDTLTGLFAIGEIPSGTRDPFALRRLALGVLRIIIERDLAELDLRELITMALTVHRLDKVNIGDVTQEVFAFMIDRLHAYYHDRGITPDVFAAVLACRPEPSRPVDIDARLRAVTAFRKLPEADSLAAANKRIANILRKAQDWKADSYDKTKLVEAAEKSLADGIGQVSERIAPLLADGAYTDVLTELAVLRNTVDDFFDHVMVMVDDAALRQNRLDLLNALHALFVDVADISCLQPIDTPR